jgi:hypothetical protein
MKIYPQKKSRTKKLSLENLTPLERMTRYAALVLAFVSVFVFFVKIIFL